jgi:hydroxyacylglutathione hydrolase
MVAIHAVPAFQDNYLWVVARDGRAAVVDPGDAAPIEAFLAARGLELAAILATHHHGDHVGGLQELKRRWKCPTFGPAREDIAGLDTRLAEGDRIEVPGVGITLDVLDVPGHTAGHIAYVGRPGAARENFVFCGDTMFACGCGRLFEGTPAQMSDSLSKLAALPADTRAYCAHEYTMANIRFAQAVEPGNVALEARRARDQAKRERGEATVPSTVADERATNPFLRCGEPEVVASAEARAGRRLEGPVEVFATLRQWKNEFR